MKILKSIQDIDSDFALTIGNFDGVHLGHKKLIEELQQKALGKGLKTVIITFCPHPAEILVPDKKSFLINSYEEKRCLFEKLGIDFLVELDFTRDFSTMNPEDFLENIIFSNSKIKLLHLGYDFAFGANKQGGHDLARDYSKKNKIVFSVQDEVKDKDNIISSTLIRDKIAKGKLEDAANLLGRHYFISGLIKKGEGRGKQIGFPTANISTDHKRLYPGRGVYVTQTRYKNMLYNSITNVGFNPTFESKEQINVETNIFDFDQDIYGEVIQVEFLKKIRDEKKFSNVNELVSQIKLDVAETKKYLAND